MNFFTYMNILSLIFATGKIFGYTTMPWLMVFMPIFIELLVLFVIFVLQVASTKNNF